MEKVTEGQRVQFQDDEGEMRQATVLGFYEEPDGSQTALLEAGYDDGLAAVPVEFLEEVPA